MSKKMYYLVEFTYSSSPEIHESMFISCSYEFPTGRYVWVSGADEYSLFILQLAPKGEGPYLIREGRYEYRLTEKPERKLNVIDLGDGETGRVLLNLIRKVIRRERKLQRLERKKDELKRRVENQKEDMESARRDCFVHLTKVKRLEK